MRVGSSHLTYCLNVHPGESLGEAREAISGPALAIRQRISPNMPFGIGLRLAGRAVEELGAPGALSKFRNWLDENGMYVFTVNAFPYGVFHGRRVKEGVYLPDWSSESRAEYTKRVAEHLVRLLPEDSAGTISTVPLGYGLLSSASARLPLMVSRVLDVVVRLWQLEQETGRRVALALEPEPDCLLQTTEDVVDVFERHFYAPDGLRALARACGVGADLARELCSRHLGVCVDTCHAAVEFEHPAEMFAQLRKHGIPVAKLQISSGLRVPACSNERRAELRRFDEPVYLHQVVVRRRDSTLVRYPDLGTALDDEPTDDSEWRVHFHVPLHVADYGGLASTQSFVRDVLALHVATPLTQHLEVETYTWDVLPERPTSIVESIAKELSWVREQL